jgi:ribosome-associated translation inhibitor RaiA
MDIQITFRGLSSSEALTQHIERLAQHLPVESCRVVVETRKAGRFHVRVELPAPRLVAEGEGEDAFVAAGEAFHAERRRFEDWAERRRDSR